MPNWRQRLANYRTVWQRRRKDSPAGSPARTKAWQNYVYAIKRVRNLLAPTHISRKGVKFVADFEGYEPRFAPDPVGIPTIGYGHVKEPGDPANWYLTQGQALALLNRELVKRYEPSVWRAFRNYRIVPTQGMLDATVSAVYNLGPGILDRGRSFGDALHAYGLSPGVKNKRAAADSLLLYDKAGGHSLPGLTRRRRDERALFLS